MQKIVRKKVENVKKLFWRDESIDWLTVVYPTSGRASLAAC